MIGLREGWRGLCLITALLYNLIPGLLKLEVSMPYKEREVFTAEIICKARVFNIVEVKKLNVRISSRERLDILKEAKKQNATNILNFNSYDLEVDSAKAILSLLVALCVKVEIQDDGPKEFKYTR